MAFLLVFYNGQCYSRFIGFYEACTGMMGASQELVELIAVHLAEQPVAKWDAVRYLIASVLLTYYSAMGTMDRGWEELQRPKSIGEGGGELVCPPLLTAHEASLLQQFGNAFVPLHAWTVHALHVGFAQEARLRPSPATGSAALSEAADCVLRVRRAIAYIKNTLAMPIPFIYFHTLNLIMYSMYTIFAFAFTSLKVTVSVLMMVLAVFVFTSLREISCAFSDPFGDDDVDFPVENYMDDVRSLFAKLLGVATKGGGGGPDYEVSRVSSTPEQQLRGLHFAAHAPRAFRHGSCLELPPLLRLTTESKGDEPRSPRDEPPRSPRDEPPTLMMPQSPTAASAVTHLPLTSAARHESAPTVLLPPATAASPPPPPPQAQFPAPSSRYRDGSQEGRERSRREEPPVAGPAAPGDLASEVARAAQRRQQRLKELEERTGNEAHQSGSSLDA